MEYAPNLYTSIYHLNVEQDVLYCFMVLFHIFRFFGWQDIPTLMELLHTCFSTMDCDAIHHKLWLVPSDPFAHKALALKV